MELPSQLFHFLAYSIERPLMRLAQAMLIISIDVDVGSRELGVINEGKNDLNVNKCMSEYRIGEIEETVLPILVEMFDTFEMPVTFAVRGQLTEVDKSVFETLLRSDVKHDIGAHGYSHREFTNLSYSEAENELNMISVGLKKFNIMPRSFVFPRNSVARLSMLARHGYKCYRGSSNGSFMEDRMFIEKERELYNIHPSLHVGESTRPALLTRILNVSITKRLPFHVWFHPWNCGETKGNAKRIVEKVFIPFFTYAKKRERNGALSFETMLSAALKVENMKSARAGMDTISK